MENASRGVALRISSFTITPTSLYGRERRETTFLVNIQVRNPRRVRVATCFTIRTGSHNNADALLPPERSGGLSEHIPIQKGFYPGLPRRSLCRQVIWLLLTIATGSPPFQM